MENSEAHRDVCDLLGGREALAERITRQLGHRPEIQEALETNGGDAVKAIGSITRGAILRMCIEDDIALEDLTGPIQWVSDEERRQWENRALDHVEVLDTVSLGDALAAGQFPNHPDLIGMEAPTNLGEDPSEG